MSRPLETLSVSLLLLAGALLTGCASGSAGDGARSGAGGSRAPAAPEWVAAPAASWDEQADPLTLHVTGSAVLEGSLPAAEQAAVADALAVIGAFLDGAQARLDVPGTRPVAVATAVQSAHVRGKFHDGRRYYVWMSCDAGQVLPADAPAAARDELARLVARHNRG